MATHNVIAIDGLSASGKGTLAKKLAMHFGFAHLDTGKIYRLVAFLFWQKYSKQNPSSMTHIDNGGIDEKNLLSVANDVVDFLTNPDRLVYQNILSQYAKNLVNDDISVVASKVACNENLRKILRQAQRAFGEDKHKKGAVIDGRDIGTVIFPDALIKFFIIADIKVRAERRYLELQNHGLSASQDAILADLEWRDHMDKERKVAPLKPADDALVLDSSQISADELFEKALSCIKRAKIF
ncbi:MAG: (d)CMP kinase [Alphaproteobacteria bacterium]